MLDDKALGELREIAGRYPEKRSGLLPMLHLVQSVEGRVTPEGIETCADILDLSPAEVSGVATFYTMYKRRPVGDHHVGVCTNTLCAVMGGDEIFARLRDHLGIGNDETTPEESGQRSITLEHLECNAACDYAPVMMVNWEFMDEMTPDSAVRLVDDLQAGRSVRSTRGPEVGTWREAERVLAGFPDGRVDQGPAAGPRSLLGLGIAHDRGWTAPDGKGHDAADESDGQLGAGTTASSRQGAADQADTGRAESENLEASNAADETAAEKKEAN